MPKAIHVCHNELLNSISSYTVVPYWNLKTMWRTLNGFVFRKRFASIALIVRRLTSGRDIYGWLNFHGFVSAPLLRIVFWLSLQWGEVKWLWTRAVNLNNAYHLWTKASKSLYGNCLDPESLPRPASPESLNLLEADFTSTRSKSLFYYITEISGLLCWHNKV